MDAPSIISTVAAVAFIIVLVAIAIGTVANTVIKAMRWHAERWQLLALRELGGQLQKTAFHLAGAYPREGVQMMLTIGGLMQRGRYPTPNDVMPTLSMEMAQLEKTGDFIR